VLNPVEIVFGMKGFQIRSSRGTTLFKRILHFEKVRHLFEEATSVQERMQKQVPVLVDV
jgi:hypothetical protein